MFPLPASAAFVSFGKNRLTGRRTTLVEHPLPADRLASRQLLRRECPARAGVYGMIDSQGELVYVGKSKSLKNRLLSYFSAQADDKAARIIERASRVVWERSAHEFGALLRELELIVRFRPRFNVQGQPGRQSRVYLAVGRAPAAYAYLVPKPTARDQAVFGPVPAGRHWRDAVRRLNDRFGLRDCPDRIPIRFADQRELFPRSRSADCLRHELGTCAGPCAGACSEADYHARVRAAVEFLQGNAGNVLTELESAMQQAAVARQFERAAYLRDVWSDLSHIHEHLHGLRNARDHYSFVYAVPTAGGRRHWYLLHRGDVVAGLPAPRQPQAARRCLTLLDEHFGPQSSAAPTTRDDLARVALVASWFRRHPEELQRTIDPQQAREECWRLLA